MGRPPRPAVPRHGQRRGRCRAPRRLRGAPLAPRRRGDRALQLRRRPGPVGARRLDARREPADLGLRVQLRRARRDRAGPGQPAHAQARPPHLGGGGGQRPVQLDELSDDRQPPRRPDDPGPDGPGLGRQRRDRRLRLPVRPERRRHPGRRGVVGRQGRAAPRARRRARDRPASRGATASGPTSTPRTRRSGAASARRSASWPAPTPTSSSSTRADRRWAPSVFVVQAGRDDRHVRRDERLHDRVRQPLSLDDAEDDQGLALRQLPRGVGREPAHLRRQDPTDAVPGVPARGDRHAAYEVHHNRHEGKLGILCSRPRRASG